MRRAAIWNPRGRQGVGLALFVLPLLACSCASSPLERKEIRELAQQPPIPRSLLLEVKFEDEQLPTHETYGSSEEWEEHVADVLWEDLRASQMVWRGGEVPDKEVDLKLTVTVSKTQDAMAPAIRGQAAFLNFLGWCALPLVSLWIEDVEIEPAVSLSMGLVFEEDSRRIELPPARLPLVTTSLSQRHPFLSWPTLGSVIAPPFVYRNGDPEHLARAIAPRVRLEAAAAIARALKDYFASVPANDLLRGFQLESRPAGTLVSFEAAADVGRLNYRRNREANPFKKEFLRLERDEAKPIQCLVKSPTHILRIEALSTSGRVAHYTLLVSKEPGEDKP